MTFHDQITNEYFEWMYGLIFNDRYSRRLSYRKLLYLLHNTEFVYILEKDENRAADGIDFRYQFGYKRGYSDEDIKNYIDTRPCSILEMMVSLSFRIEEQIMDDYDYGDRTGQWFWNMVVSLGLGHMSDSNFDRRYAERIISKFLNRQYKPNGEGGLFTLENPKDDLTKVEIWYQAMWYLDENFDFSI